MVFEISQKRKMMFEFRWIFVSAREKPNTIAMDPHEASERLKAEGNALYAAMQYKDASKKYKEAISLAPSASLHTNRAACHIG
jgi:hypothetical protein